MKEGESEVQSFKAASSDDIENLNASVPFKESDAGDGTNRSEQELNGFKLVMCTISLVCCMFLVALDQMIVVAILDTITTRFNSFSKFPWIVSAFMITMGSLAQTWGRFSISFGRKWVMIIAIIIFEIGSLIAGVAVNMNMFIVGRAIQGIGGSGIQSLVMIIATEISNIHMRPIIMGCVSVSFVLASVIGPLVGGLFAEFVTWRWCFYINLCFGGVIFPLFVFTYKPEPPKGSFIEHLKTIDFIDHGLLISSIVLLCLALSFGETEKKGWQSAGVISCFVLGGVLMIAFVIFNWKFSKYPTLPPDIMSITGVNMSFLVFVSSYTSFIVVTQFMSIYFQKIAGHNAFHTGLSLLPAAIPVAISAIISGIVIKTTGIIKPISVFASMLLVTSSGLFLLYGKHEKMGYTFGFQIIAGIAVGLNFQGPAMSAMILAPKTPGSTILTTAYMNAGRSVASAIFSLIGNIIFDSRLASNVKKLPLHHKVESSQQLLNIAGGSNIDAHDKDLILGAMTDAFHKTIYLTISISAVCVVSSILMPNVRMPKDVKEVKEKDVENEKIEGNENEELEGSDSEKVERN